MTTDNAGNTFTSATITVTVDNTVPSLSVNVANPVNAATADPTPWSRRPGTRGSGIANVSFEQCTVANDDPAPPTRGRRSASTRLRPTSVSWPIPADGTRLLRVRATDNAGRQTTELVLITVDRTRPTGARDRSGRGSEPARRSRRASATASDTAPGSVNTVTFQRSPAGAGAWTDVSIDSAPPYNATLDTTALADGLYDLRVFTTDSAGNAEATPATMQVRVDNTLPTGTVTAPANAAAIRGTVALTSNSADAGGSGVDTVQFQRSPAGAGTWTNQRGELEHDRAVADGQYDLRVMTTDNAGNAFTSAAITVRVDNTNPTGSVTAPAAAANLRDTVTLTSNSTDAGGSGVAPSSSSARRPAQAPGRTRLPPGTRTTSVTASTTSAS